MKLEKIADKLKQEYPPQMAMAWDNPGLQVGRMSHSVKKVLVALDATNEVIETCVSEKVDLLVTHHPLILSGVKKISTEDYLGEKALTMAEHGIAHYAMHTNYDVVKMAELAKTALKLKKTEILEVTGMTEEGVPYGIGCVGTAGKKMTASHCCQLVKKAFSLDNLRLFGDPDAMVERIAVSPGSGKSMIGAALTAKADVLITGDIGHHDGIDAVDQGLLIIDAGHYGLEHLFIRQMAEYLKKEFPKLDVQEAAMKQPFEVL